MGACRPRRMAYDAVKEIGFEPVFSGHEGRHAHNYTHART